MLYIYKEDPQAISVVSICGFPLLGFRRVETPEIWKVPCIVIAQGAKVTIVDDDVPLGKFLQRELKDVALEVVVHTAPRAALTSFEDAIPDLLVLDLNLPEMDGMEVLREVRNRWPALPVLVLTARSRTEDLVNGFEQGADDFLVKPFSMKELVARIKRLLHRQNGSAPKTAPANVLNLNRERLSVTRGQRRIDLTPREFAILEYLVGRAGVVVSRKSLMEDVWNVPFDPSTNIVDVYVKYLRDKIDKDGERKLIRTVRGIGYVLSDDDEGQ